MTSDYHSISNHKILVVACNCDLTEDETKAARNYSFSQGVEDAIRRLTYGRYACVIACVDPSTKESIEQLQQLQEASRKNNVPLATISRLNPQWIENLMAQFGVAAHFKHFPEITEIADIVANSNRALSDDTAGSNS